MSEQHEDDERVGRSYDRAGTTVRLLREAGLEPRSTVAGDGEPATNAGAESKFVRSPAEDPASGSDGDA